MRACVIAFLVLTSWLSSTVAGAGERHPGRRAVGSVLLPRSLVTPSAAPVANVSVDEGDPFAIRLGGSNVVAPVTLYVVPADRALVITDIDGSYTCNCSVCRLFDSDGMRLAWRTDDGLQRSYVSGVRFAPGTTVTLDVPTSCGPGSSQQDAFNGFVTFMGRLVP